MATYGVKLPDVGEGVAEAEVVEWLVAVGEEISRDQALAEVMTDKATVQIEAPVDGTVLSLNGAPGDLIAVGADLVLLDVEGSVDAAHQPEEQNSVPAPSPPPPKTDNDLQRGQALKVPDPFEDPFEADLPEPQRRVDRPAGLVKPLASPAVRKRALDAGVELRFVNGSGPAGRISHADLDAYLRAGITPQVLAATAAPGMREPNLRIDEVPLVGLRRRIAAQMSTAKSRIPHITYVEEVDVSALEDLRKSLNESAGVAQPKLTVLPLIVAAVRSALGAHPEMNARFDDEAEVVRQHGAFHCGVAADTPKGLVVPVIRHAETLDLWGLATEIARLAQGARDGSLSSPELSGSTFTISSLGALGGVVSTPVINHPEVAILAVNKIAERPVVIDGTVVVRKMMNLSGSFDHRVVDGMDVAKFMQQIKRRLEQPALLFIDPPGQKPSVV